MRLEHLNITVTDLTVAMKFLGTAFPEFRIRGQGESEHDGNHKQWIHFGTDDAYIALEQITPQRKDPRAYYLDPGINHLGFEVSDFDALCARLQAAGFAGGPVPPEPHRQRAYFLDGIGTEWEFVAYSSAIPGEKNWYPAG